MEESLDRKKKDWLVRSSMKILGPYDYDEIVDSLHRHQISIIDEIRNSDSQWAYIREHALFEDLVHQLRAQQENSSETTLASKTTTGITKTKKIGMTRTDLTPLTLDDDTTPLPVFDTGPMIKDITPLEEVQTPLTPPKPHLSNVSSSYGASSDQRLIQKFKSKKRWMYLAAAGAITVILGSAYAYNLYRRTIKLEQQEELQARGRLWVTQGFYAKAMDAFRKAQSVAPLSRESEIEMAFLYIQEDRPLEARRIFESHLSNGSLNKDEVSLINNGLGLSSFKEGDYSKAADYFDKALAFNPNNSEAKLNYLILKYHRKENQSALVESMDFVKKNPNSRQGLTMLALITQESLNYQSDDFLLKDVVDKVKSQLNKSHELKEILAFQVLNLIHKLDDATAVDEALAGVFSTNPFFLDQFASNLHVDQRYFNWSSHSNECHKLSDQLPPPKSKLVKAICLIEEQRELDAAKIVEEYLREFPEDKWAQTLKVSYLFKIGKVAESLVALDNSLAKEVPMGLYVGLRACIESDDARCAMEKATAIYSVDKLDSFGLYGMAWSLEKQGKQKQALEYLSLSLRFDPGFLPAVEMQSRIEGMSR